MVNMVKKIYSFIFLLCMTVTFACFGIATAGAANASSTAGKVSTQSTSLNVRSAANTSSSVVASLKKDSWVTLMSKSGDYWKVEYASGKYGYCSSKYIKQDTSGTVKYVSISDGTLNVRSGAGTSYAVKSNLTRGKCVIVLKEADSWSKILYNGTKTGYVKSSYLSYKKPATYSKITLEVPLYKQTDSRWKNIKIGTQGDTIGSSGCTTTCVAMVQSFHTGTTVTPDKMAAKLTYSESGMLYWPQDFKTELASSADYLSVIYNLLKSGKPVILGCKKASGAQHWVVVTGYNGSTSSLSASGFQINDPGASRTVLSEFVSLYPNVYKVAYK